MDGVLEELVQLRKREADARARCKEADDARVQAAEALAVLRSRELLESAGGAVVQLAEDDAPPRLLRVFPEAVRANAQLAALLAQAEKLASELGHPAPGSVRSVGSATPKEETEPTGVDDTMDDERKRALELLEAGEQDSITLSPTEVLAMRKALEPCAKRSRRGA